VRIDGGDGFDTLTVIGTEFGDDFVVTDRGIYGAGLFITYQGLESIVIDALQGNDRFFIESSPEGVAVSIYGGLGSDTFNVGGSYGQAVTVVSNDLSGHSGLVIQTISRNDPLYQNVFLQDLSAEIADNDEAGIVVDVASPLRVFENSLFQGLAVNSYTIVLSRRPEENVQITASPIPPRETDEAAGGNGIALATTMDGTPSAAGVTLIFTKDNWFIPQCGLGLRARRHARGRPPRVQHPAHRDPGREPERRRRLRRSRGARRGGRCRG
jgi:hypothetical protein